MFCILKIPERFRGPTNLLSGAYRISFEGIKLVLMKLPCTKNKNQCHYISTSLCVCMAREGKDLPSCLRTAPFWTDKQRSVAIPYGRFETTCRSHNHGLRILDPTRRDDKFVVKRRYGIATDRCTNRPAERSSAPLRG